MAYDVTKLAKLEALKQLAEKVKKDFVTENDLEKVSDRIDDLVTAGGEPNAIKVIKVNGEVQTPTEGDKVVDIKVPQKVSELNNDNGYQTAADVTKAIDDFAKNVGETDVIDTLKDVIDYCAKHKGEATKMMSAISALEGLVGDETVAKQIADAITSALKTGGVDKYALVTELASAVSDITENKGAISEIQTKLSAVAEGATKVAKSDINGKIKINDIDIDVYNHPTTTIGVKQSGFYKITTDVNGHVTGAEEVDKSDIINLGIPGEKTAVTKSITNGNVTVDGQEVVVYTLPEDVIHGSIATSEEVNEMLTAVFAE